MSRNRTIPDAQVFAAILHLIATDGEKAVAFSAVARATGLAAPSLVQRYGSLQDMFGAAMRSEWDRLDAQADNAIAQVQAEGKGVTSLLKALAPASAALLAASARDATLRERAARWRARVEAGLSRRPDGQDTAAMLFAVWQGQCLWAATGDKDFKLKDAVKRLG